MKRYSENWYSNFLFFTVLVGNIFLPLTAGWAGSSDPAHFLNNILKYPKDVRVTVFSSNVPKARHMAFDDAGNMFLSRTRDGAVVALPDANSDGVADRVVLILSGGNGPHGLAFVKLDSGYYLYVAEEDQVVRLKRGRAPFEKNGTASLLGRKSD